MVLQCLRERVGLPMRRWRGPRSLGVLWVAVAVGLCSFGDAFAQEPPPAPDALAPAESVPPLPDGPDSLDAQLQQERARAGSDAARAAHFEAMQQLLEQWREVLQAQEALRAELQASASPAASETPTADSAILALGELEERQWNRRQSAVALRQALVSARRSLESASEELDAKERLRRDARAALVEAKGRGEQRDRFEQSRLASVISTERVALRRLEVERAEARVAENSASEERLAADIERARDKVRALASAEDPSPYFSSRESGLARRRAAAELAEQQASRRLRDATKRDPDPQASLAIERRENLNVEAEARSVEFELVDRQLAQMAREQELYSTWEAVLRDQLSRDDLRKRSTELTQSLDDLEQSSLLSQVRLAELRERRDALARRIGAPDTGTALAAILRQRDESLARLAETQSLALTELARVQRLVERVAADVSDSLGQPSFGERWNDLVRIARDFWAYEIMVIDDEGISVGTAVLALVLLVAGFTLSRRVSRQLGRLAVERLSLDPGVAAALETFGFYVLLIAFTLFALRTVNFPLTIFTLAGGALAIGIGFGSQNVMNNFISGLILMLERPIRARDLVEIDGTYGTIEAIGARSTIIRASDSTQLIVPNSFFLENRIVNWTLSDDVVRTQISVGVAYGSPTREVERLLRDSMMRQSQILKHPVPVILFSDFGDNALSFQAFFWMRARSPMAVRRVESELRFSIDELFRGAGIVIAFPQRDVHLDVSRPIQVQLEPSDPRAPGSAESGEEG